MSDGPVREAEFSDPGIEADIPDPARQPLTVEPHEAPAQEADRPVREGKLSTLGDMQKDGYVFFTPALVVTHGLFDRDPVIEFNRTHQTDDEADRPFHVDCDYPFFQDLGKSVVQGQVVDWDHRIYGIVGPCWAQLRDFIGSISCCQPSWYHYAKIGWHSLEIPDPTALHSGRVLAELPMVDIFAFCVSTCRYFAWLVPARDPPRTLPFAQVAPPRPEIKAEAAAAFVILGTDR